jgi:hypothetical protein
MWTLHSARPMIEQRVWYVVIAPNLNGKQGCLNLKCPQCKRRFRRHTGSCPRGSCSCNKACKKTLLEGSGKIRRCKRFRANVHHARLGLLRIAYASPAGHGRNSAHTTDVGRRGQLSDVAVGAFEVHARQRGCSHRALGMLSNRFGPATLFT